MNDDATHGEGLAGVGAGGEERRLPELTGAVLDAATVDRLFADLEACTEIIEVQVKTGARDMTRPAGGTGIGLDEARALVQSVAARAVQVRYRYEGGEWCDTLMVLPPGQGVRLVRIRQ